MKALVLHNYYRSENASGENLSVNAEISALRDLGWDIELVSADSDLIADGHVPLRQVATRPVYSNRAVKRVREAIRRFHPNVALVENVFPLLSPWVIRTLQSANVPVAAGVRSYRMWCATSSMFRDGAYCDDCVGSLSNLPAIRHACYHESRLRTVPMAASITVHRSTFRSLDAYLPVTEHVRHELIRAGMPAERIVVRPNFVDDPGPPSPVEPGAGFVFGGRLTAEKGVDLMIEAWKRSEVWREMPLRIAGSGELAHLLTADPTYRIEALGLLDNSTMMRIVEQSSVMVVPSVWPEPFGRGVIEAAARGRASLVTDSGGLPSLVEDGTTGWVSAPDVSSLAAAFRRAADRTAQVDFGEAARRRFEDRYTREISIGILDDTLRRLGTNGTIVD